MNTKVALKAQNNFLIFVQSRSFISSSFDCRRLHRFEDVDMNIMIDLLSNDFGSIMLDVAQKGACSITCQNLLLMTIYMTNIKDNYVYENCN